MLTALICLFALTAPISARGAEPQPAQAATEGELRAFLEDLLWLVEGNFLRDERAKQKTSLEYIGRLVRAKPYIPRVDDVFKPDYSRSAAARRQIFKAIHLHAPTLAKPIPTGDRDVFQSVALLLKARAYLTPKDSGAGSFDGVAGKHLMTPRAKYPRTWSRAKSTK